MRVEQLRGLVKIAGGKAGEVLGRLIHDGSLEARGKVLRLSGRAVLAVARARSTVKRFA